MLAKTPLRARSLLGPLCALLISVLIALASHPGAAQAAAPGTVPDLTWGASRAEVDRTVSLMQDSGVRWVRMNVAWNSGEENGNGSYNAGYFADVDYAVAKARAAGMDIVASVSDGVPYWASADPTKSTDAGGAKRWRERYRPRSFQDYGDFFRYVAERYKDQGVHTFEVWNEPNLERFWQSGVNPGEYAEMLKAAYPAIKAADPSARVLLGGLSQRGSYEFMQGVYDAGGGAYFDSAAYHVYPYGDPAKCWKDSAGRWAFDSFCSLDQFRRIMIANGDAAKDVWITEYGFSTCSNSARACYGVGVTEAQQAAYLVKMQRRFDSSAYSYVKAAFLYQFRDWTPDGSVTEGDWEENLGVLHRDFTPKRSFAAFKAYNTTGAGKSASPDSAPLVKLASPVGGATFTRSLILSADVRDDDAVSTVVFLVDGRPVGKDPSAPYRMRWAASKRTGVGRHKVTAKAYDGGRLVASSSATVRRVPSGPMRLRSRATLKISSMARAAVKSPAAGARAVAAVGRVKGASGGRLRILLRRLDPRTGRWIKVRTSGSTVDARGRYRAILSLTAGRWRAQTTYLGMPRSASKVVGFRV